MAAGRIACLIALTMVASTLPANVWPAPAARADDESAPGSRPDTTVSHEPDKSEDDDSSSTLQITLNADVWDGGSARSPGAGPALLVVASLPPPDPGPGTGPADPDTFTGIEAPTPGERSQRRWLTCRYAHAPPVGG